MWKTKFGKCIYTSPSGYKVYQNWLYRWFTLGSTALQTVINRRAPQKPVLYYLPALTLLARLIPGSCCLLGLGGAGVPHMLAHNRRSATIVAVDNSQEVIQIAKQFFMTDRITNLEIVNQDALTYVKENNTLYKHLLVDLYDANHFPAECASEAFFIYCKNRLEPQGFIAINLANIKEQWSILQLIKKQFRTTVVIPVKNCTNIVVIASKSEDKEWLINILKHQAKIKKLAWIHSWGYVGEYNQM